MKDTRSLRGTTSTASPIGHRPLALRRCACGGSAGHDGECAECRRKRLQRREQRPDAPAQAPAIAREVLREPGRPLDTDLRESMEARFGHDFRRVRIHTGSRAARAADAVGAVAYTAGSDIVFGGGVDSLRSAGGRWLLAHELTHVVQQQNAGPAPDALEVAPAGDAAEHEADAMADRATGAPAHLQGGLTSQAHTVAGYTSAAAGFQREHGTAARQAQQALLGGAVRQATPLGQIRRMARASDPFCFVTRQGAYKTFTGDGRDDAAAKANRNVIYGPVEFCHTGECINEGGTFPSQDEQCD